MVIYRVVVSFFLISHIQSQQRQRALITVWKDESPVRHTMKTMNRIFGRGGSSAESDIGSYANGSGSPRANRQMGSSVIESDIDEARSNFSAAMSSPRLRQDWTSPRPRREPSVLQSQDSFRGSPREIGSPRGARSGIEALVGLPEQDKRIFAVQRKIVFMKKPRGETIIRKGDAIKYVHVILTGLVMVFRSGQNYADFSLGPGDSFGDEILNGDGISAKTFRAANDVHYCEVDKDTFLNSELFATFRERMESRSGKQRTRVGQESSSTATESSSRTLSPDDGSSDTGTNSVFFGPVGNICTSAPLVGGRATNNIRADMYEADRGRGGLEKTPRTVNNAEGGASKWCFLDILNWG